MNKRVKNLNSLYLLLLRGRGYVGSRHPAELLVLLGRGGLRRSVGVVHLLLPLDHDLDGGDARARPLGVQLGHVLAQLGQRITVESQLGDDVLRHVGVDAVQAAGVALGGVEELQELLGVELEALQ